MFVFYIICGVGSAWLFRCTDISENILTNLPDGETRWNTFFNSLTLRLIISTFCSPPLLYIGSGFATVLRLSCCAVALTSYPLCLVPAAEMITSHIGESGQETHQPGIPLRIGLVIVCTGVALAIPDFGLMVSIIGNFSVSMVSFVLPSAMAVACTTRSAPGRTSYLALAEQGHLTAAPGQQTPSFRSSWYYVDIALLILGIFTCVSTTYLTLSSAFSPSPPSIPPPLQHQH